jgi:hypothetical protein
VKARLPILVIALLIVIVPIAVVEIQRSVFANQSPTASFTYSPATPTPGETITFNASASYDSAGSIVQYSWDFGDGTTATITNPIITYAYPIDGTYTVQLTVTDNSNATGVASAVVEVSTVTFFRVCFYGSLIPIPNVKVTVYYYNGAAWMKAPTGPQGLEMKYDNTTPPGNKYRNPGYTATKLEDEASNIGFDLHPCTWTVYFKFEWCGQVAYWPNDTTRVYTYRDGIIEAHDYLQGHQAYYDSNAGTYVIKVSDIPGHGVAPTDCHPIIVGLKCPPPIQKYYLTVKTDPASITTIPGQGWYTKATNITLTAPLYVNVSSNTRYQFNHWDVDGTSKGGGVNPIIVCMNANHTATAHYLTQYSVTFYQSGLSSDATGTVVVVDGSGKAYGDLPYSKWVNNGGTVTYSFSSAVSSSVSGKQYRLTSVTGSTSPITVIGSVCITGCYAKQYSVTFAQTGLDSTATGTVVTVNGNAKAYGDLSYVLWVDSCSSVTYSYTSSVSSSTTGKRFRLVSVSGPSSTIKVTGPTTVTGNYVTQYSVTFAQTGLDSTTSGTVVTVNGKSKTYSDLPYTLWVDSGGTVTYSYGSSVSSTTANTQFRLTGVTGPGSSITVSGPTTVTGNYVAQYLITFAQTGLDSTASGTVATVNSYTKTYSDLPFTTWADSGSSVSYSFTSPVSSSTTGKRFRLNSVTGSSTPITVTGATTVTGNYVTQYSVTFAQTGLDSTATGTVVTVNSNAKAFGDLSYVLWVDSGSKVTYSYNDPVLSTTTGKRFKLTGVSGTSSPITVTSGVTVSGTYKMQFQVTFDQTGVGSDFAGSIVTIESVGYNRSGLPVSFWWDSGSSHGFSYGSPLVVNANKQYAWSSTAGLTTLQGTTLTITASGSVTGNYVVENSVTFDQTGASSDFTGTLITIDSTSYNVTGLPVSFIWQSGSTHSFSFQSSLLVAANSKQYVWTGTSGLSSSQSGSITVSGADNVVGHYKGQYYLTLATNPSSITSPSGAGWYDANSYGSISTASSVDIVSGSSRYKFANWTTTYPAEITGPSSASTTVLMDMAKTVTGNYITQYAVKFDQTGVGSDFTSPVVTIDGVDYSVSGLSVSFWWGQNSQHTITWYSPLVVTANIKQYVWTSSTGLFTSQNSSMTVTTYGSVTGNYGTQYYLTVISPYRTVGGQGWYNSGDTAYATLNTPIIDHGNGTRHIFTSWGGDACGTTFAQSDPIKMDAAKTAVALWKTRYSVTFTHAGLDSTATGTVVTVNGSPKICGDLPYLIWVDAGTSVTYSYGNVSSTATGERFILTGVAGPTYPMTVTTPTSVIGSYKIQYKITFSQSGVGSDFTGTIVTVDSAGYNATTLSTDFWWDSGSSHTFAFASSLIVNAGKEYDWSSSTGGLSTLQGDTLTISSSGSVIGNYLVGIKYQITFSQTGVGTDFSGTIVTIDGIHYNVTSLPVSFWWDRGSRHPFLFGSPLSVNASKQYVWANASGLLTWQGGTITASSSGSVTGNYKTQYYLTVATSPSGVDPTGAGWYDAGTSATIYADAFVDITPGSSRYRFNGWTTPDMPEITDPSRSPTTIRMDKGKTVTANYVVQYKVCFSQSGVSPDFGGNVATVDGVSYGVGSFPKNFWWDNGIVHTFAFNSPLAVAANSKQYLWTGTTGLSTLQSGSITVSVSGNVTGGYKIQYYLTVSINPSGIATISGQGWYDSSTTATLTAPSVSGYQFGYWDVDGTSQGTGVDPITVTMDAAQTATAYYAQIGAHPTVTITPLSATVYPGGHVDFSSTVTGGTSPYGYQWYLDGNPVSGALSSTWTFIPTTQGVYYVYLKVTDALNSIGQSATAQVVVLPVPVGGYSVSLTKATWPLLACYATFLAMFIVAISLIRRKRK